MVKKGDFEHGMVVDARHVGLKVLKKPLSYCCTQPSLGLEGMLQKREKYPVSGKSLC